MKIKINWYGSGLEIKRLLLPAEIKYEWESIALKQNTTLIDALLDPFFYYKLKNKKYNSLEDLPCQQFSCLLHENKNQIEFWFNRKKVFKTNTFELFNEALLFPIFNLQHLQKPFTNKQGIYIVNKEIGNLGVYELEVNTHNLTLDNFIFETELYQNIKTISRITYLNQSFSFIKKDTAITSQSCFEVKSA
jgi:hypothetical protein